MTNTPNETPPITLPPPGLQPSPLLLIAVVAMAMIGVVSVITIAIFVPEHEATLITTVIGLLLPTTAALLALLKADQVSHAVQDVHIALNSRLTQLLEQTALASAAAGRSEAAVSAPPPVAVPLDTPVPPPGGPV